MSEINEIADRVAKEYGYRNSGRSDYCPTKKMDVAWTLEGYGTESPTITFHVPDYFHRMPRTTELVMKAVLNCMGNMHSDIKEMQRTFLKEGIRSIIPLYLRRNGLEPYTNHSDSLSIGGLVDGLRAMGWSEDDIHRTTFAWSDDAEPASVWALNMVVIPKSMEDDREAIVGWASSCMEKLARGVCR